MTQNQLIGAEVSLYTGKLRCYLKYKNIPFEEVIASKEIYRDVILPRTGVSYIPVFITEDDVALQDTTEIIDFLEQRYPEQSIYPAGACQKLIALLLETYADEWLVIPAMHYRWSFEENRQFAIAEFGRTSAPQASEEEQLAIGQANSKPFAGALPRLGVMPENIPAIESSYLTLLADLDKHFEQYPFLLGSRPSIGDFGLIGPLYAHLYRDPYSGRLMKEHAPNVASWVKRMINPKPKTGDFLPDDQVPETLQPILNRMFSEQGTVLQNTMSQIANWAATHEEKSLPRAIGETPFVIEGIEGSRLTFPYMQWMWQRCADAYQQLDESERIRVAQFLERAPGAAMLLSSPIEHRVTRQNNKLTLL